MIIFLDEYDMYNFDKSINDYLELVTTLVKGRSVIKSMDMDFYAE
jgi:hypothetical protein